MKIICLIPARGGSKGLPGKNIKSIAGKALIVHSIDYALHCPMIDIVYVSTDDNKIANISKKAGAHIILRPDELSGDNASSESAISHALSEIENKFDTPDIVVFLQATSPHRPKGSLEKILNYFIKGQFDSLLTLSPTHRFFWKIKEGKTIAEYDYLNRPRRQDMKIEDISYVENGSVYVFTSKHFKETANRLGGKIGSYIFDEQFAYEIDSELDFQWLEKQMQ